MFYIDEKGMFYVGDKYLQNCCKICGKKTVGKKDFNGYFGHRSKIW